MSNGQGKPRTPKTTTTSLTSGLADVWAKDMAKAMDRDVMALFGGRPTPKAKPLTKWQKCKRFMTKKRYAGRWLTYKLMEHYDIYEGDW